MITQGGGRWTWAARDAVVLCGVVLAVATATVVGWEALALVGALSVALLAGAWLLFRSSTQSREWVLLVMLGGLLLLPMVTRTVGVSLFGPWQAVMLGVSVLGIPAFAAEVRSSGWLRLAMLLFGVYLALGFVSSWAGRTRMAAGAYQLFSDLKPLLLLCLGYALRWDERTERWLWAVVKTAWIPMLLLVIFEWGAPGPYFKILYHAAGAPSEDPTGLLPSRAIGLFEHPSFLATVAALFALMCMSRVCNSERGRGAPWIWRVAVYALLIVCSVQRQEMVGCALAVAVIALLSRPERLVRNAFFILLLAVPLVAAFLLAFSENIQHELAYWGVGSAYTPIEIPRAQIFLGAFHVADGFFPLGSGLGTYGGAGAEKFDASLYYDLGFRNYWWFGKQDYLMDTYWPNPIAEMGFFGAAALLLSYLAMFGFAASRASATARTPARAHWLAAAGMMVYMLALSGSSPAFQDPRLYVIPAIMFGVAATLARREAHATR